MRALLIVNPSATSTKRLPRAAIVRALASAVELTEVQTRYRGHATQLAADARSEGYGLVLTLGGDGTVNEAVNGILGPAALAGGAAARLGGADARLGGADALPGGPDALPGGPDALPGGPDALPERPPHPGQVPALAALPGGSANVFPRALGLPRDPMHATTVILKALADRRERTIGVGLAEDRYFVLNAGLGFDAEVVRAVESLRSLGRTVTPALYVRTALRQFYLQSDRRHPALTIETDGGRPGGPAFFSMVLNAAPWTYLGGRAVQANPDARFDCGLDLFALRSMSSFSTFRAVGQMLSGRRRPHGRDVVTLHDQEAITLRSERAVAFQIDGEYVGERDAVVFRSVPRALRIIA